MKFDEYSRPAIKTAAYFFVFGFLWILLSDEVLHQLSPNYSIESELQTLKGWFFILITTILIFVFVKQQVFALINLKNRLALSERSLSVVLENIGEGIITTNSKGIITGMNKIAVELTGVDEMTGRGRHLSEVLKIFDHDDHENLVRHLLGKTGVLTSGNRPLSLHSSTHQRYMIYCRSDDILDIDGNVQGKITAFRDVTSDQLHEEALRKSEQRYKNIVELTHDLIWTADLDGTITFINDASRKIYGFTPGEMIGKKFSEFIPKEVYQSRNQFFYENLKKGVTTFEIETELRRRDGKIIYVKDNISAIFDETGKLSGVSGASKDITTDKLNQKALVESKERLELALKGGDLGLWDYNTKTNRIIINDQWKHILGIESEGNVIDGDFFSSIVHPDDQQLIFNTFNRFLDNQTKLLEFEYRIRHKSGSWKWVLSKGKIVQRNASGEPVRIIGANIDITEKKNLELELQHWVDIYRSFIRYATEGIYLYELEQPMPVNIPVEKQIMNFYHQGYVRTCNDSFARMYGYEKAHEVEGMKMTVFHGGDDVPENVALVRRFIESDYNIRQEVSHERDKDGNDIYISNNVVGILENNMLVRIWGSQSNITAQVMAQKALENSERRYRLLFETNPVPLIVFDLDDFNLYDANHAAEELLGYRKEEMLRLRIWDIRPEISLFTKRELRGQLMQELSETVEIRLKAKSGRLIQAEVSLDQIDYEGRSAVLAAINDLTALKEAEKRVIQSLIEGENNERRRIAKELHDSLGQSLTAASLNFSAVKNLFDALGIKNTEKFNTGLNFLKSAIEESRNIAHNLMPNAIEDFGLIPSLKSLFSQIEKSSGTKVSLYENMGEEIRLNKQIELNLYRITQEALNNTIKHAEASEIFVQLVLHKTEIIFTFEDNGRGFNVAQVNGEQHGMGLKSIYNRVKAMSGTFEIDSVPSRGTSLTIQIPI